MSRPILHRPRILEPNREQINFAAAYYEGEGHPRMYGQLMTVKIGQNDRERLDWLVTYFGGTVTGPYNNGVSINEHYYWYLSGSLADEFLNTIYPLLVKSRQDQIDQARLGNGSRQNHKVFREPSSLEAILENASEEKEETNWELPSIRSFMKE